MIKALKTVALTVLVTFLSTPVYAQPPRFDGVVNIINNVINIMFPLAAFIAVVMVIIAGYMWMISQGDPQKMQKAQGTITWAVLGLIFLAIFRALLDVLFDFITT